MQALKDFYLYFKYFKQKVGAGLYLLIALYFAGSYFSGFGIALLLPILNFEKTGLASGPFSGIAKFFEVLGVEPSFTSLLVLFASTFLFKGLFQFFQDWYRVTLAAKLTFRLQRDLATNYSKLNFAFYSKTKSGFFTNIFTSDANNVVSGLYAYITALGAALNSAVLFAFAFTINPKVTVAALMGGGLIFIFATRLREMVVILSKSHSRASGSLAHHFIQFIVGFKYLKSIEGYFRYLDLIDEKIDEVRSLQLKQTLNKAFVNAIYEPITVFFLCAIVYVQVIRGGQSVTEIGVPLLLLSRFLNSFFSFQRFWHDFCGSVGSITALEDAMATMAANCEISAGNPVTALKTGIEVKNLDFHYGDKQVLNKINLFIPKNKCIAIVGDSGAGKTTLLNVLTGLLPADKGGDVFYDGQTYAELDKIQLRSKFGYIVQEAVLFDTTIENNITLWKNSTQAGNANTRLVEAAKMAHCLNFISNYSDGFSRIVGDRGTALSGGQRQRLMIAREIYRSPEILVFDEATSSLDSESEGFIQETIRSFLGSRTMVIVAHRVSSLRICDYIYVIKEGRVVEQGTWDELLQEGKNSYFSKIHGAQQI